MSNVCQVTEEMKPLLDESLQVLGLLVRTVNGLENHDGIPDKRGRVIRITTIGELLERSEDDLLARPGFGDKTLKEIRQCLAKVGFHTRQKYSQPKKEDTSYKTKMDDTQVTFQFGGRKNNRNVTAQPKHQRGNRDNNRKQHRAAGDSTRGKNR